MNLPAIRQAICDAVKAGVTSTVRCEPYLLNSVAPPTFAVGDANLTYHGAMGHASLSTVRFTCWLVVSKASDRAPQRELDSYLTDDAGGNGILPAIEADQSLGGTAQAVVVRDAKTVLTGIGDVQYYGAQFTVEVYA